jgi:uncharacterized membrane protein
MQNLSYHELKYFAKVQGISLLIATLLLSVSHNMARYQVNSTIQYVFIGLAAIFGIVFAVNIIFGKQLSQRITAASIVIYSVLSLAMLFLFLYS